MRNHTRRRRTPGVHLQFARRYVHPELTRGHRSSRVRRSSALLRKGMDAVETRYTDELDSEMMHALHDAVVRLLRPHLSSTWSDVEAADKALEIAQQLLEEPLRES